MAPAPLPSLPAGYSSRWIETRLQIEHRWRRAWGATMMGAFLVIAAAIAAPVPPLQQMGILALVYGGALLPWFGLAYLSNRTRFQFDINGLRVRHGPVPLKLGRRFHRNEIKRLHTENHGVGNESWYVGLELHSGRRIYIIEGARRFEDAKRLERVIAEQLELREDAAPDTPQDDEHRVPAAPVPQQAVHEAVAQSAGGGTP